MQRNVNFLQSTTFLKKSLKRASGNTFNLPVTKWRHLEIFPISITKQFIKFGTIFNVLLIYCLGNILAVVKGCYTFPCIIDFFKEISHYGAILWLFFAMKIRWPEFKTLLHFQRAMNHRVWDLFWLYIVHTMKKDLMYQVNKRTLKESTLWVKPFLTFL